MNEDERAIAHAIADRLAGGDDAIASSEGTITLHGSPPIRGLGPPRSIVIANVRHDVRTRDVVRYDVEIVVRRRA